MASREIEREQESAGRQAEEGTTDREIKWRKATVMISRVHKTVSPVNGVEILISEFVPFIFYSI